MRNLRTGKIFTSALLCSAALVTPLWAPPALAQSAATPAPAEGAAAADDADSNAIIVTAQRRSERLEDVPMSVSVVSPETLANAGISSVRDLANVTSGFQVGNSGNTPQPAIRGITTTNAGNYENNVALFVDGLYQPAPQILNMDLPNVQNIQILKGPQGTLYGRNATGGAILIDTLDPGNEWQGSIEATYGRFDDRRARGYIAGPLSEGIGLSLAGTFRHTDGFFKKASQTTPGKFDGNFLGLKQESVRAKLKFDLSSTLQATLGYNYLRAEDARGVIFTPIENVSTPYTTPGRTTRPRELGEVAGDIFELDFKQHEGSFKLEWDTGIGKLRSVSGYNVSDLLTLFDSDGTYVPVNYSGGITRIETWQENLDYTITAIDKVDLTLGGNYYNIKTRFDPYTTLRLAPAGTPDPAITPTPISSYIKAADTGFYRTKEAWAVFAAGTFHATDRLSITVGARYSKETQDVSGVKFNYCAVPTNTVNPGQLGCGPVGSLLPLTTNPATSGTPYNIDGAPGIPASRKRSNYSKFTPSASIRFEISPRTNIYASYSQGFRGGEWNAIIPSDNPALWFDAKQESVKAYEVGLKSAGRRFNAELAGFYYDYTDLQVAATSFVNGVALVVLQNAPSAEIYGLEGNFDYRVTANFKVRAGATWLHAHYGDGFIFTGSGVNPAGAGFNTNSDPLKVFPNVTLNQNLSGLQMARSPDFTGFAGFEYNIPNQDGGLRFAANLRYTTSYVVTNPSVWGGEFTAAYTARVNAARAAGLPDPLPDNTAQFNNAAGAPYVSRASEQRARQGAFATVSASITWTDPTDRFYVRAWGTNLTNAKYVIHYQPSGTYKPMGEPLTFGGTIGFKF